MHEKMDDRKLLFAFAFSINMMAFVITVYLFSKNAIEGNPVMSMMFSHGVLPALLFSLLIWALFYVVLIYFPNNAKKDRDIWVNASKYCCALLAVLTMIDFINDYIWLMISM